MSSFADAIRNRFHNGFGRDFCQELSFLCGHDLCKGNYGLNGPRETFADGFKLERKNTRKRKIDPSSTQNRNELPESRTFELDAYTFSRQVSKHSYASLKSSSVSGGHNALDKCTADFIVMSAKVKSPLLIFECKSQENHIREGLIQLVSHGLALRNKKLVSHETKLVLLTPTNWSTVSLPPFALKDEEENLSITFDRYQVFKRSANGYIFHRKDYIAFLKDIRQHFDSVKSVK